MTRKPLIGINTQYRDSRKDAAALTWINTGYYDTNVAVTVRQDLGQRWALNGRLGYSWYDYESDRNDDVLNFRAGLDYSYNSRLKGGIDYDYQDSNSNRELGTYTRNRVTLRVSYEF